MCLGVAALLIVYFVVRHHWRREEEETRWMYHFVEKIIGGLLLWLLLHIVGFVDQSSCFEHFISLIYPDDIETVASSITDVLREHHDASKNDKVLLPYLPIPHVRDMLIPPSDRLVLPSRRAA